MRFLKFQPEQAQVPVFAAIGSYMHGAVEDLFCDRRLVRAVSIRHASILLIAGSPRAEDQDDIRRLHDQMPHPRASVWWKTSPDAEIENPLVVDDQSDPLSTMISTYRKLIDGRRVSEPDLLPNKPPQPWRGKGDYGQGGEGMMGGNPYGRPMPMTDDDLRDGLSLDAYTAPFGPFLPMLPPGFKLSLTLQGDVIQSAEVIRPPFAQVGNSAPKVDVLRRLARFLQVLGLEPHSERCIALAHAASLGKRIDVAPLRRLVRWSGARLAIPPGLGMLGKSDVRSRFEEWLDALDDKTSQQNSARNGTSAEAPDRLVDLLRGLEWNEAVLVINSFDSETLAAMSPVEGEDSCAHEADGHASRSGHREQNRNHSMHGRRMAHS